MGELQAHDNEVNLTPSHGAHKVLLVAVSPEQERESLRQQSQYLQDSLDAINRRI